MCNSSGIAFVAGALTEQDVKGRRVLEVGARNVNGTVRPEITRLGPSEYLGVDISAGEGVDRICGVEDLLKCFSAGTFAVVVSTEVLEHVRDWRLAVGNMKALLGEGGTLIITTRSYGFGYHGYPYDFWRFEEQDMREIFGDMTIVELKSDPSAPGVFMKAVKKAPFIQKDLSGCRLYSIIKNGRAEDITDADCALFRLKHAAGQARNILSRLLPEAVKPGLKRFFRIRS